MTQLEKVPINPGSLWAAAKASKPSHDTNHEAHHS